MSKVTSSVLIGATLYEFRMQLRRKALWIATGIFFALTLFVSQGPWQFPSSMLVIQILAFWTQELQTFMPVAFGILLADRLPRDRLLRADELLDSLPGSPSERFLGKYIGATLATLLPLFLIHLAGVVYVAVDQASAEAIPLGLAMFAAASLPGLLFVAAFSISCPVVIWVPLYQFLFTGYWFWGNWLLQGPQSSLYIPVPTLSGTLLTPAGYYAATGLFGVPDFVLRATAWEGLSSIGLLVAFGVAALDAAHRYLTWRKSTR